MYRLLRSILFLLPAELAHKLGIFALKVFGLLRTSIEDVRANVLSRSTGLETRVGKLSFAHPIALAAGLDKDAEAVAGLFGLGFSAIEVGTVTPRPQPGNPKPRLFRIPEHQALINRMGFNNHGAEAMADRLSQTRWRPGPLGINIGKNKDTALERAVDDYVRCVDLLAKHADYVVVNASSPNTPGLRGLQQPEQLRALLQAVRARMDAVAPGTPLFLKVAPDLAPEAVDEIVDAALAAGLDGLIATNTTIARPFEHPVAKEPGGLSGAPVRDPATEVIRRAYRRSNGRLPIIGVGGIFTAEDAYRKLRAGASLVQVYTGFIYEGPGMARKLVDGLQALMRRDGVRSVSELVGQDA